MKIESIVCTCVKHVTYFVCYYLGLILLILTDCFYRSASSLRNVSRCQPYTRGSVVFVHFLQHFFRKYRPTGRVVARLNT